MPAELGGVVVVTLIIGVVEIAKGAGVPSRWAPLVAVGLGVVLMAGNQLAQLLPAFAAWYDAMLWGLAAGLTAVGLYSGAKNTLGG